MALSRVRARLAAWFAVAFLAGLAILDLSLYWYLRSQADHRLTRDLVSEVEQVIVACRREFAEAPADGVGRAAENALAEWQAGRDGIAVYDAEGRRVATGGPASLVRFAPLRGDAAPTHDVPIDDDTSARLVWLHAQGQPAFVVLVVGSTERLSEDDEALAWWLAVSSPIVAILSLIAGYLMSRRALRPIGDLERAVASFPPGQLHRRLPVPTPGDEIGRLATRFNTLLERLELSQAQSRAFLRRAAHQIRTPLTLVLGEAELSLERTRAEEEYRAALGRIHRAAGQMQRRVNDLFLLAQAEAGERILLDAAVDLDGLALEASDLMRQRAQLLGRHLEIDRADPLVVRGSTPLLQEAVVELLENACRHSAPGAVVAISTFAGGEFAVLSVSSEGDVVAESRPGTTDETRGFGLPIVRWIAEQHGGKLVYTRNGRLNSFALMLPLLPAAEA